MPARRRGARRHLLPHRPRDDGAALGFDRPTANSLDSVSDRDFVLETLAAAAIAATHLSRFAEEIVLWTTPQFGFVSLSDTFTTGSSIMPQKRNPDAAELVRAKSGPLIGDLAGAADGDEGPAARLFEGHAGRQGRLFRFAAVAVAVHRRHGRHGPRHDAASRTDEGGGGLGLFHRHRSRRLAGARLGMPFRQAHHVTGRIVALAAEKAVELEQLTLDQMQAVEPAITQAVFEVLGVENSVRSRLSYGGTAPDNVRAQARAWRERLNGGKTA